MQSRLALAEGFTNAVRHAHKDLPKEVPITVKVFLRLNSIEIQIWDYGSDFDLNNFIVETARQNRGWLSSGRGIPLLNKIANRLDYQRKNNRQNCLLIVKNFSSRRQQNLTKLPKKL